MKDFFNYELDEFNIANGIDELGWIEQSTYLLAIIIICILIFRYKSHIREFKYEHIIRYIMATILIVGELAIQFWMMYSGNYELTSLPMHLCSISLFAGAFMLIRKSERLHYIIFFWALQGALQALLQPNVAVGFNNFRYYHFSIMHGTIVIFPLYMMWVHNWIPTFKHLIRSFIGLILVALPIMIFNTIAGTDFFFVNFAKDVRPETGSILDLLGPQPYYVIPLLVVAFVLFFITYIPIHLGYHMKSKEKTV